MIEWRGFRDRQTGLPVYSLYGDTREPLPEMLAEADAFVIDLQDIGARYYTFIWTLSLFLKACEKANKPVFVLDRPNPISGLAVEGPVLREEFSSFVGLHPLPVRHGLTIGEVAIYLKNFFYKEIDLHVIAMEGWRREMFFEDTKLPWVFPSPNIPFFESAKVYPGMCLLEGTNISEGRGTTRPFEVFGAPFINSDRIVKELSGLKLSGVFFRPLTFIPTFHKWAGETCGGAQIHITDREKFMPFLTGVAVLKKIHDLYPEKFEWKRPPYEYEHSRMPIDILCGNDLLRKQIEEAVPLKVMSSWWSSEAREFDRKIRKSLLIYR